MASLYELEGQWLQLVNAYDCAETDEEAEQIVQEMLDKQEEIGAKADVYAKIVRNKLAEADAYKAEKNRLAERQKAAENVAERLKQGLLEIMKVTGQTEIKTSIGKWKVADNPWKCEVLDIGKVPEEFHIHVEDKIDKAEILRQFKETGEIIPGCEFKREQGIRFK